MTELEFQLRASDLLETVKKIQRDFAEVKSTMDELITALHLDTEMWRDRYEAECADHERSIRHFEKATNEDVS